MLPQRVKKQRKSAENSLECVWIAMCVLQNNRERRSLGSNFSPSCEMLCSIICRIQRCVCWYSAICTSSHTHTRYTRAFTLAICVFLLSHLSHNDWISRTIQCASAPESLQKTRNKAIFTPFSRFKPRLWQHNTVFLYLVTDVSSCKSTCYLWLWQMWQQKTQNSCVMRTRACACERRNNANFPESAVTPSNFSSHFRNLWTSQPSFFVFAICIATPVPYFLEKVTYFSQNVPYFPRNVRCFWGNVRCFL